MITFIQLIAEKLYNANLLTIIPITIFAGFLIFLATLSLIDIKKKRKITKEYFISFIIPCYNSEKTLEDTVKSLYGSYDPENFELFVINDNSQDNTLSVMKNLRKKFNFNIINNAVNEGKAKSINNAAKKAKGEIIFILDSDTIINRENVCDIVARFNSNEKIAAVSCPYKAKGKSFFSIMQSIEYSTQRFFWQSHNIHSSVSLWGGCLAARKNAFYEVNGFSETSLLEDMDFAMKLNEKKYKVEQSIKCVETSVPESLNGWLKQKIRWNSGSIQCMLTHFPAYFKNPISVCLLSMYVVFFYILLMNGVITSFYYNFFQIFFWLVKYAGFNLFHSLTFTTDLYKKELGFAAIYQVFFIAANLPYAAFLVKKFKDIRKIIWVIPFSLIYCPLFYLTIIIGSIKGYKKFMDVKKGMIKRAW